MLYVERPTAATLNIEFGTSPPLRSNVMLGAGGEALSCFSGFQPSGRGDALTALHSILHPLLAPLGWSDAAVIVTDTGLKTTARANFVRSTREKKERWMMENLKLSDPLTHSPADSLPFTHGFSFSASALVRE
jgi:hypothetical protein